MAERDARERDILVASNEFAYVQDLTKGDIVLYVGPTKISLSNTERLVELKNARFSPVRGDETSDESRSGPTDAARCGLLWEALAEVLGGAATSTLLRRAARCAASRNPDLSGLVIHREGLDHRYAVPLAWQEENQDPSQGLRDLFRELRPLLVEFTGEVVIRRLLRITAFPQRSLVSAECSAGGYPPWLRRASREVVPWAERRRLRAVRAASLRHRECLRVVGGRGGPDPPHARSAAAARPLRLLRAARGPARPRAPVRPPAGSGAGGRTGGAHRCAWQAARAPLGTSGEARGAGGLYPAQDVGFAPRRSARRARPGDTRRRGQDGLGLGLAIVQSLVELHGGRVHAQSPGEGSGSTITVELPLASDAALATQAPEVVGSGPAVVALTLEGLRVLVADDDTDAGEVLRTMLEQYGAEVTLVASAAEALGVIERSSLDVLLSDLSMLDDGGQPLMRQVTALSAPRGTRLPAAALTADAGAEDRTRALGAGFQMYLTKPIAPARLAEAVARLVRCR